MPIPPSHRPSLGLALVSLIILLFWMSLYVYVPILPVYAQQERGASLEFVGLIVASYGLLQLLLRVPYGYLSDRLKRRRPFVLLGLALAIVSALGLARSPSAVWLLAFRTLSGAAAGAWAVLTVWFASFFPPEKAVRATGLATFLNTLGTVLASSWGGQLAQNSGWMAPFYAAAAVGAAGLLILPLAPAGPGSISGAAGPAPDGPGRLTVVRRRDLIDRPLLVVSLAAAAGQYATYATTFGFIPIYAESLGASRAQLGLVTSAMQLAYLLAAMGIGLFATARLEKTLALLGLAGIAAASLWVPIANSVTEVALTRILHGVGLGLSFPVLMGLSIKRAPGEHRALLMGIFQAIYALGMFAGPALSGFIAGSHGIPAVFTGSGLLVFVTIPFLYLGLAERRISISKEARN